MQKTKGNVDKKYYIPLLHIYALDTVNQINKRCVEFFSYQISKNQKENQMDEMSVMSSITQSVMHS